MILRSLVVMSLAVTGLWANEAIDRAQKYEDAGNLTASKETYSKALKAAPADADVANAYAETLERYRDPAAREAYRRSAALYQQAGQLPQAASAERRAVLLDAIAGDRAAKITDLVKYRDLGGKDSAQAVSLDGLSNAKQTIQIPGPLRSFARMAAISPTTEADDVLAALARNIVTNGYQASRSSDELDETEYLKLVERYLAQARELAKMAGPEEVIHIETCESTQTNDLLRSLGYRIRGQCGGDLVLETVNAGRAFITTDSGFPLAELEQSLRTDKPFRYEYHPAKATVLYGPTYWLNAREKGTGDFLDTFIGDPGLCRFYLGMSKLDPETAEELKNHVAPQKLRAVANVLDFFGGNFEIRQGKAVVPGGAKSAAAWSDLAGASTDKGAEFFEKLMQRDDGWLASLYDSLARLSASPRQAPLQAYLTDPLRMKRLYSAVRGRITTPGPARPVFRSNTDMMLLATRLHLDSDGHLHIPGGIDSWRELFTKAPKSRYDAKLSKAAANWKEGDDVVEALFALCRKPVENEPLRIFMALSDIDRNRAQPLKPETVQRMVRGWGVYGAQYTIFNDAPALSDKTIVAWLDTAVAVDHNRDGLFRQDVVGTLQGLTGLWQIFCRQGSIPAGKADDALAGIIAPFGTIKTDRDLFDAGRGGVEKLAAAAGDGSAEKAGNLQAHLLGLLAGGPHADESDTRAALVQQEQHIFEAQRLLSVDLLFELADNLDGVAKGGKLNAQLTKRLASRVGDIQLPRMEMSSAEKSVVAFGYYPDRHVDDERKLNLRATLDKAAKDPEKLKALRGKLAPALRDTIVGYNYLHYAPPGAQILITNPLFVRGHDFIGAAGANHSWRTTEIHGTGWPANAGGRLVGSLSGLPYALAEAEQNFLVPTKTQALIWGDLVPEMILTARSSRFWTVTPAQMHWVGLHMRLSEDLIAEATIEPAVREEVSREVYRVANPSRANAVMQSISSGDVKNAIETLTPSEMYTMAANIEEAGSAVKSNPEMDEITHLRRTVPEQVSDIAISRAWGTAKPTLANSYRPELLSLRTFPTLMGYSSRMMAESWESNLLYWADVGDQMGVKPAELNLLVPEWTQKVAERIFASHLEDWPALLRSLRSVGEDLRTDPDQIAASNVERPADPAP